MITVYIYDKKTGQYLYTDIGNPDYVIADMGDDKDFTLTAPPDNSKVWRWVDNAWQ